MNHTSMLSLWPLVGVSIARSKASFDARLRRAMWAAEPVIPDRAVYAFGTVTLLVLAGALVILGYAAYIKLSCECHPSM